MVWNFVEYLSNETVIYVSKTTRQIHSVANLHLLTSVGLRDLENS